MNNLTTLLFRLQPSGSLSAVVQTTGSRCISTTASLEGKKNFRKFLLYNKRGPRIYKEQRRTGVSPDPELPIDRRGVRETGYMFRGRYVEVPEKIPQLVVPDLTGCQLKPYVSYKTADVVQSEFTSQDLFNAVYSKKIIDDYKSGKLDADGNPLQPSEEEQLQLEEAWTRARRTGSDMF